MNKAGLAMIVLGTTIGAIWHLEQPGTEWLAALLPGLWWYSRSRVTAGAIWLGYYLALSTDVLPNYTTIYPDSYLITPIAIWIAHAVLLSLPWIALWNARASKSPQAWAIDGTWRGLAALFITTVPPLGTISWASPLLASGLLFPGLGFVGLAATVMLMLIPIFWWRHPAATALSAAGIAVTATIATLQYVPAAKPAGWVALDIERGRPGADSDRQWWIEENKFLSSAVEEIMPQARVIVLPELIAGEWRIETMRPWIRPVQIAAKEGQTVIFGALNRLSATRYQNGLVFISQNGISRHGGRLPMPVGLWRPWSNWSAEADWFGRSQFVVDGRLTAISICFEDFMVFPFLLSMLPANGERPSAVISIANNWFGKTRSSTYIQARSIELQAQLFGIPVIRSVGY